MTSSASHELEANVSSAHPPSSHPPINYSKVVSVPIGITADTPELLRLGSQALKSASRRHQLLVINNSGNLGERVGGGGRTRSTSAADGGLAVGGGRRRSTIEVTANPTVLDLSRRTRVLLITEPAQLLVSVLLPTLPAPSDLQYVPRIDVRK